MSLKAKTTVIAKRLTSLVAFFAMLFVTLTQVSEVGFCESTAEIFVGQHEVEGHSECSHSHEKETPSDCSDGQEPCEDQHLEIDLEVDDFVRATSESDHSSSDEGIFESFAAFSPENLFRPRNQIVPSDFARPPPDLPVYLRFGVMRL